MSAFSAALRDEIVRRAGNRCEYCHLPTTDRLQPFPLITLFPEIAGVQRASKTLRLLALAATVTNGSMSRGLIQQAVERRISSIHGIKLGQSTLHGAPERLES
jgi:hypothetical protein